MVSCIYFTILPIYLFTYVLFVLKAIKYIIIIIIIISEPDMEWMNNNY